MAWVSAVTDRTAADIAARNAKAFLNVADWTRIDGNTSEVAGQFLSLWGETVTLIDLDTPTTSDIPSAGNINDLVTNIERLRAAAYFPAGIGLVALKDDYEAGSAAQSPDYTDVNAWEENLDLMHTYLPCAAGYAVRCGVAEVGQARFWQSQFRG